MNLLSKMHQTVTFATKATVDGYGDPTFSAQTAISARVESKRDILRGTDGTEIESNHVVFSATQIPLDARVWLPGDNTADDSAARRVVDSRAIPSLRNTQVLYEARL